MDNRAEVREFLTLAASQDHPAAGRAARRRAPPRARAAPRRGRRAGRGQRRVLRQAGTRRPGRGRLPRCSTRSPARCNSTTPNAPTCSTSPTPPTAPAPACARGAAQQHAGPRDPRLQWVLDAITAGPAIIRNGRMDLLATNHLGRAMHASLYDSQPGGTPNFARYTFLDDDSHRFYPDWDTAADTCVAILRTEAGRDPHDKALHDLVGELSTRSDGIPPPLERARRPPPRRRNQTFPPQRRRQPRTRLRKRRHDLRARAHPHPLRRRTRIPRSRHPETPRILGGRNPDPNRKPAPERRSLKAPRRFVLTGMSPALSRRSYQE